MRRILLILVGAACLAVLWAGWRQVRRVDDLAAPGPLQVAVAYNPRLLDTHGHVLAAYASVLAEEGVPHVRLDQYDLLSADAARVAARYPALILPDGACQIMNSAFAPWLEAYLAAGGALAVIYDAGTRGLQGGYVPRSFLAGLTGIRHIDYAGSGAAAYATGSLRFRDPGAAARCEIPPGKLDGELFLCGYGYGRLAYPCARSARAPSVADGEGPEVLADVVLDDGAVCPAVALGRRGAGHVLYVNLPLGHLKAHDDDLPLRALLRSFLFREVGMPHLVSTPAGRGGVVINWHLDANGDWPYLERMRDEGLLRRGLPASIHITAGPDLDAPGDGLGFDAGGAGRPFVRWLGDYGEIGSHGGWSHNLFAREVAAGRWDEARVADALARNAACLAEVTGRPVREYSAPAGVHPQPLTSRLLRDLGVRAYYYTGDSGSAPNRSFHAGRPLADSLVAVPVMPRGAVASLAEMDVQGGLAPSAVREWLFATADYCAENRTVRLVYSHPYNLYEADGGHDYRPAFAAWLDHLEALRDAGRLQVRPMIAFADHLLRVATAELRCTPAAGGLRVELTGPGGLRDLAVALPRRLVGRPQRPGIRVEEDARYWYLILEDEAHELALDLDAR